jgi:hypothetical protein
MKNRWLLLLGLGLLLGCGRGSEIQRGIVSGKVSYQGRPVADGMIMFVPTKGTKGPSTNATITDGVYKVNVRGGVPVGIHRVEIDAFRTATGPASGVAALGNGPRKEQYLPKNYNRESTLEATIEAKEEQTQNLDLK